MSLQNEDFGRIDLPRQVVLVADNVCHPTWAIRGKLVRYAGSGYYALLLSRGAVKVPQDWAREIEHSKGQPPVAG